MMEGHAWADWLEVGDKELDGDHHLQMRLVSALVDALEEGRPWLAHRLADHLHGASESHFGEEEGRMRAMRDPELAAHRRDHDVMLVAMNELLEAVDGEDVALAVAGAIDLRSKLASHIGTYDRRLAAYARQAGSEPLIPAS
jgi:hemerythrin